MSRGQAVCRRHAGWSNNSVKACGRVPYIDIVARIKPGSRKGPLVEVGADGQLTIYVREPAVDGKANAAVIRVLAEHLGVPRSSVELVGGATARLKRFRVS